MSVSFTVITASPVPFRFTPYSYTCSKYASLSYQSMQLYLKNSVRMLFDRITEHLLAFVDILYLMLYTISIYSTKDLYFNPHIMLNHV